MQTKSQHYVPRFLLKNFRTHKGKVYVTDKKDFKFRLQNPNKIAFANHLYTLEQEDEDPEIMEKALANIESGTAPVIRDLLKGRSLDSLKQNERMHLAAFVALQLPRVYKIRSYLESIKGHRSRLKMGPSGIQISVKKGPDDPRFSHISLIQYAAFNFTKHLLEMTWVLLRPFGTEKFIISDNPVTIYNTLEASKMVNLYEHLRTVYPSFDNINNIKEHLESLLVQDGVEICLPLSPQLALILVKPSTALLANLNSKNTLSLEANQSDYVNLLQLVAAEKYIYSVEELPNAQIPEAPDQIWEIIVEGLSQTFIERNFIMQRVIKYAPKVIERIESKRALTGLAADVKRG